jgi:ketosteroid isomerase-like protein
MRAFVLLLALTTLCLGACASGAASLPVRPGDLWLRYTVPLTAGDAARAAQRFTEDAILMEPDNPDIVGRPEIENVLRTLFANNDVLSAEVTSTESHLCGDVLTDLGTVVEVYAPKGKAAIKHHARYAAIWRRDASGEWRISRLMMGTVGIPDEPQ